MTIDLSLILVMGVMYGVGVYLILDRTMTRVLLGLMLLTNATNLLIFHASGPAGLTPIYDKSLSPEEYSDPLPQAFALTSIVISFAVTALLLGLIYRQWVLSRGDKIMDDLEDRKVATQPSYDPEEDTPATVESSEFDGDEETREKEFQISKEKKQARKAEAERQEDADACESENSPTTAEGARS